MTTKQFLTATSLSAVLCFAVAGAIVRLTVSPTPAPAPVPSPTPAPVPAPPAPVVPPATIAQQKAKLKLTDGRTATFWFAASGNSLQCTAAIGLDQVLSYALVPAEDPSPTPAPAPDPIPTPMPTPTPAPTPQATSNLRVLFLYDPLTLVDMSPDRQAILGSAVLRSYLDKHCPAERGCTAEICSLTKTPSYRFLPTNTDVSRLPPVWQQTYRAAAGKPAPWLLATNEAGQTVIDRSWPTTVNETLKLLKKYGGD
jgi:hypothetical protein